MERAKKLSSQLGHTIKDLGAHMPSSVVGVIRKRRKKSEALKQNLVGGSKVKPLKEYDPYPMEFLPSSM